MKKMLSVILVFALLCSVPIIGSGAEESAVPSFVTDQGLYAHAVTGSADTEAWTLWQYAQNEDGSVISDKDRYFFLPSSAKQGEIELYNAYDEAIKLGDTVIEPKTSAVFNYNYEYNGPVTRGEKSWTLHILRSTAEAAIFVNNQNADGAGAELFEYLKEDKSLSAKATGAIVTPDGKIDNTAVKKIKGRGNTTWAKPKKPFNITYNSAVSIAGMPKGKKYSLLANYQDATLARNRILYDLSDEVGMPYASDSRFVDFYINGVYYGSYQCAQKIEVGSNDLINDISDKDYLTEDNTLAEDFSFCVEIDPSYGEDDYHTSQSSNQLTIKSPEIDEGKPFYDEVKEYVKAKFKLLSDALYMRNTSVENLSNILDIDSFAKIYLINELGKNWDSGVSSLYMVYKKSPDGVWRFYASPVWDYDNSLGNAVGIANELRSSGVSDYTDYKGWWCKFKGKNKDDTRSRNLMNNCALSTNIMKRASQIWIEEFAPVIKRFLNTDNNDGALKSCDYYYNALVGSAKMNYERGWLVNTGAWIADHSELTRAYVGANRLRYNSIKSGYSSDFEGEFLYMRDWLESRAAWLTVEFNKTYVPTVGDAYADGRLNICDVTAIQLYLVDRAPEKFDAKAADYDKNGSVTVDDATKLQLRLANY